MIKFLQNQKFPVILFVSGVLLIIVGFFEIKDLMKLQFVTHSYPILFLIIIGAFFSITAIALYYLDNCTFRFGKRSKIFKLDKGFGTIYAETKINIIFGRLEKVSDNTNDSLVVLPANEYFDDECRKDTKSALGAYVNYKFPNQNDKICEFINKSLLSAKSKLIEKEPGVKQKSYGIGTSVFLNTLSKPLLFVAVTTKRLGEGLNAELTYIFKAVKEIQRVAADNRISSVYVPVMGSGHGRLRKEVALLGMLLAFCDGKKRPYGQPIQEFNIVVFQDDDKKPPLIAKNYAKHLLRFSVEMFS